MREPLEQLQISLARFVRVSGLCRHAVRRLNASSS
jgi:hypothetical protein